MFTNNNLSKPATTFTPVLNTFTNSISSGQTNFLSNQNQTQPQNDFEVYNFVQTQITTIKGLSSFTA